MAGTDQSDSDKSLTDESQALYILKHVRQRRVVKFNADAHDYTVQVPPMTGVFDFIQAVQHLHELFEGNKYFQIFTFMNTFISHIVSLYAHN